MKKASKTNNQQRKKPPTPKTKNCNIEFENRLAGELPPGTKIKFSTLGAALATLPGGKIAYLGCEHCHGVQPEINSLGYPSIDGHQMLRHDDAPEMQFNGGPELLANLWLCPFCKTPNMRMLPKYVLEWAILGEEE